MTSGFSQHLEVRSVRQGPAAVVHLFDFSGFVCRRSCRQRDNSATSIAEDQREILRIIVPELLTHSFCVRRVLMPSWGSSSNLVWRRIRTQTATGSGRARDTGRRATALTRRSSRLQPERRTGRPTTGQTRVEFGLDRRRRELAERRAVNEPRREGDCPRHQRRCTRWRRVDAIFTARSNRDRRRSHRAPSR